MRRKITLWRGPVWWYNTDRWSTVGKYGKSMLLSQFLVEMSFREFSDHPVKHSAATVCLKYGKSAGRPRPLIQRVNWALLPGFKWPRYQADYSYPPSVDVKNSWGCKSTPSYVFISWYLNNHRVKLGLYWTDQYEGRELLECLRNEQLLADGIQQRYTPVFRNWTLRSWSGKLKF